MMKMKSSAKEMCGEYAVKAVQGVAVAAVMPAIFVTGIVCAGLIGTLIVGEAGVKTIKKIKNRTLGG